MKATASKRSKPKFESPLDRANGYEVNWQNVSKVFDAVRGGEGISFVYVIGEEGDGPVKIGVAKDPIKRLRNMQTGNPRRLRVEHVLIGDRFLEALLHETWEPSAIRSSTARKRADGTAPGTEWFEASVRPTIDPIMRSAAARQVEYVKRVLEGDGVADLERLAEIVYKAHLDHGHEPHERDEVRLLAAGAGYAVQRASLVQHFRGANSKVWLTRDGPRRDP